MSREAGYLSLYRALGFDKGVHQLAQAKLHFGLLRAPSWQGFPPALLPFAETSSGIMYGYWQHWLVPTRRLTIVEFYGQTRLMRPLLALEYARNFRQFAYSSVLDLVHLHEGVDKEVQRVATSLEISDLEWIDSISLSSGDDPSALLQHPLFANDPPHRCFQNDAEYPGDFPHPGMEAVPSSLLTACGYEIHSRFGNGLPDPKMYRNYISHHPNAPDWLTARFQPEIFYRCLSLSDLAGAWLSLNSPGWQFSEARQAIKQLAKQVDNLMFSNLADAWCSISHESKMGDVY